MTLTEDQQAVADAITRAVIGRRAPSTKPSTDPYADLAASYAEDTDGEAPRPGTAVTPQAPTDPQDTDLDIRGHAGYRPSIDEAYYGFHVEGDHRYE